MWRLTLRKLTGPEPAANSFGLNGYFTADRLLRVPLTEQLDHLVIAFQPALPALLLLRHRHRSGRLGARRRRRMRGGLLIRREDKFSSSLLEHFLDGCREVQNRMKSIRDLLCIGRTDTGALSVQTAPVTRNGGNSRAPLQPRRQAFTRPV